MMTALSVLSTSSGFEVASQAVITYLKKAIPLGYWSVSRFDGDQQVYLTVSDDAYGTEAGDSHPWSDSFCIHMVAGTAPRIAPDAMAIPQYASAGVARIISIGAYIGVPIRRSDGELFGTLCGLDPHRQLPEISRHLELLELLTDLLSKVLDADLNRTDALRVAEVAKILAETDPMTALLNRRGWERFVELEEARYRQFGDPCSVIVIDLDGLKQINDTMGHDVGDAYIETAARCLTASSRGTDIVARLGGDEFGIVATGSNHNGADLLVERLRKSLTLAGVSASIGYAPHTIKHGFGAAWKAADEAMYAEKALHTAARNALDDGQHRL